MTNLSLQVPQSTHDLNNMLSLFHGYVDLLADPNLSHEKRQDYVNILHENFNLFSVIVGANQLGISTKEFSNHLTLFSLIQHGLDLQKIRLEAKKIIPELTFASLSAREIADHPLTNQLNTQDQLVAMICLIFNLLENAARYAAPAHPLYVSLVDMQNYLELHITNQCEVPVTVPLTMGIGLNNVMNLANKLGATLTHEKQDTHKLMTRLRYPLALKTVDNKIDPMQFITIWQNRHPTDHIPDNQLLNHSVIAYQQGQTEKAISLLAKFLIKNPHDVESWRKLAIITASIHMEDGTVPTQLFLYALSIGADAPSCYLGLVRVAFAQGETENALSYLEQLIEVTVKKNQHFEVAANHLGEIHDQYIKDGKAAATDPMLIRLRKQASRLSESPNRFMANRAELMAEYGQLPFTQAYMDELFALLNARRDFFALREFIEQFLEIDPDNAPLIAYHAKIQGYLGNYKAAHATLTKAIERLGQQSALLSELGYIKIHYGDYKQGYEFCSRAWDNLEFMQTNLRSSPVIRQVPRLKSDHTVKNKRIVLLQRDGFGNMIQSLRFIVQLQAHHPAQLSLYMQSQHQPIRNYIEAILPQIQFIDRLEDPNQFDYWAFSEHLPAQFGIETPDQLPPPCPAPISSSLKTKWQTWLDQRAQPNRPRFAIAVGGEHSNRNDALRSMRLNLLYETISQYGQLINLQSWLFEEDQAFIDTHPDILNPMPEINDFMDSAAILQSVDMVIAVDSGLAHLGGNQGIPTWVMLYDPSEYRWPAEGDVYAWYPRMRLFRQKGRGWDHKGDWTPVLNSLRTALPQFLSTYKSIAHR